MPNQDVIELRWIFEVIRRNARLIVAFTLAAAAIAFVATTVTPPVFEATASLFVQPAQDTRSSEYNVIVAGERLALTLSQMIKGRPILDVVITKLDLKETPDELAKKISVEPVKDTQLIRLVVKSPSPGQAALLANTIAEEFTNHFREFQSVRYAGSVKSMQYQMDTVSEQVEITRSKIQTLNAQVIGKDAELAHLESVLTNYRTSYRDTQRDYQTLQLTAAQYTDNINIVEKAQSLEEEPQYLNTATVTLILNHTRDVGGPNYSTETYEKMLVGRPVLESAITKTGIDMTSELLGKRIKVTSVPETQLLFLSVVDSDFSKAALLANTIAEVFISQMKTLQAESYAESLASLQDRMDELSMMMEETQTEIAEVTTERVQLEAELASLESLLAGYRSDQRMLQEDYELLQMTVAKAADSVVIAEPATAPARPIQYRALYVSLATLIGLLIALGYSFLLEYMKDVVRAPADVSHILGISTLGSISQMREAKNGLVVITKTHSPVSEAFRVLANNIRFAGLDRPLRTLLVTSPHAQEGKSLIVGNLATASAQRGLKVVAVDADLRLPRLHQLFNLDQGLGLTGSLLEGNGAENLKVVGVDGLRVLTSGDLPPNPAEVLASPRMRKLLDDLAQEADLVLIDSSPVLPVADAAILASLVDGVLMVLQADQTRRQDVRDAAENLRKSGGHLVGVVLNGVPSQSDRYYRYAVDENGEDTARFNGWGKSFQMVRRLFGSDQDRQISKNSTTQPGRWKQSLAILMRLFNKAR